MTQKDITTETTVFIDTVGNLENEVARIMGLTSNETKIYLALLGEKALTASQLSTITGIHRTRVYDNLKGLENKGLITCINEEPKQFVPVPVTLGICRLIEQLTTSFERRKKELYALQAVLQKLEARREIHLEPVYIITIDEILDELRSLLAHAKERVWVCKKTAGGLLDWSVLKNELKELQRQGIDVRILSDRRLNIGFPTKIVSSLAFSFAIVDSTVLCFFFDEYVRGLGKALVTSNNEFLSFLANSFQTWWKTAEC